MVVEGENLGTALRRWRDRLTPEAVGLPHRAKRRAAGLRREELADLAGLSVDYVVRLEQGRATNPSAQVVATLARALHLSREERDHAYRLSGLLPPRTGRSPTSSPPACNGCWPGWGPSPSACSPRTGRC